MVERLTICLGESSGTEGQEEKGVQLIGKLK